MSPVRGNCSYNGLTSIQRHFTKTNEVCEARNYVLHIIIKRHDTKCSRIATTPAACNSCLDYCSFFRTNWLISIPRLWILTDPWDCVVPRRRWALWFVVLCSPSDSCDRHRDIVTSLPGIMGICGSATKYSLSVHVTVLQKIHARKF
jgi:hypothetical protein